MSLIKIRLVGLICFLNNIYGMNGEIWPKRGNPHIILNKRAIMGVSGTLN